MQVPMAALQEAADEALLMDRARMLSEEEHQRELAKQGPLHERPDGEVLDAVAGSGLFAAVVGAWNALGPGGTGAGDGAGGAGGCQVPPREEAPLRRDLVGLALLERKCTQQWYRDHAPPFFRELAAGLSAWIERGDGPGPRVGAPAGTGGGGGEDGRFDPSDGGEDAAGPAGAGAGGGGAGGVPGPPPGEAGPMTRGRLAAWVAETLAALNDRVLVACEGGVPRIFKDAWERAPPVPDSADDGVIVHSARAPAGPGPGAAPVIDVD